MLAMMPATTPVAARKAVVSKSMRSAFLSRPGPWPSEKRLDAGLCTTEDQRVDIVRALVGVHRLQVREHAHHMVFLGNAVAAVHIARKPRDIERLAAIIALHQRDRRWRRFARFEHAPKPQRSLQPNSNFGLHIGKLLLNQLVGGERTTELLAIEHVLAGPVPTKFSGAHGTPGNAVACVIKAAEWAGEASHVGQ